MVVYNVVCSVCGCSRAYEFSHCDLWYTVYSPARVCYNHRYNNNSDNTIRLLVPIIASVEIHAFWTSSEWPSMKHLCTYSDRGKKKRGKTHKHSSIYFSVMPTDNFAAILGLPAGTWYCYLHTTKGISLVSSGSLRWPQRAWCVSIVLCTQDLPQGRSSPSHPWHRNELAFLHLLSFVQHKKKTSSGSSSKGKDMSLDTKPCLLDYHCSSDSVKSVVVK